MKNIYNKTNIDLNFITVYHHLKKMGENLKVRTYIPENLEFYRNLNDTGFL